MARVFRYYGKKRGHRRSGSPALGGLGETVFFAALLLFGCAGLAAMFFLWVVPEWRVNQEFLPSTCKVLDKQIVERPGDEGTLYAPKFSVELAAAGEISTWSGYDVHKTAFNNRAEAQAILDRFELFSPEKNNRYPCWYDPDDPYHVVLVRGYNTWTWWAFTVPLSLAAIGAGGLLYAWLHWGKSAERRMAAAARGGSWELLGINGEGRRECPFVPLGTDMTNSPGTRLRYRLPMAGSPGWSLFGALLFCVLWNTVVAVFIVYAVRGHAAGRPNWLLTLFLLPFVLIGLGAAWYFLRHMLIAAGVSPTRLEISAHPLRPGEEYRVLLLQAGRLRINAIRASLVCEESAAYRQGTNTRTETQAVVREELYCRENFEIRPDAPFEAEFALVVPPGAMHSFAAEHNEINWSLVVEGNLAGWPDFRRVFPVVVHPAPGGPPR